MSNLEAPASHASEVTPNDEKDLPSKSRAIWVGIPGNVKVTMLGGETLLLSNLSLGWHPLRLRRIWATDTTADAIVAIW